jgi:vesicle coat complex subunit
LRPIRWQTADQILSLRLIDHFTRRWPSTCHAFIDYHQEFFLAARDDHTARRLKVDILSRLTTEHNVTRILMDCEHHFHSVDIGVVQDMIRLVRNCAGRFPRVSEECLSVFMQLAQLDEGL